MATDNNQPNKEDKAPEVPPSEVSTNPELGIKRVRTFEDDLKEAKAKAGVKDTPPPKKGFFGKKKSKKPMDGVKKITQNVQPEVTPQIPVIEEEQKPSKEYIENELARSGIVAKEKEEKKVEEESSLSAIRTYKNDAAESIQENKISRVSIAAAEQNKRVRENNFSSLLPSENSSFQKNAMYILLSIVLIGTGIWGASHFFRESKISTEVAITPNQGVLLFTNEEEELAVQKLSGQEFVNLLNEERQKLPNNPKTIKEIKLVGSTVFGERAISASSFLDRFINVPGRLKRALSSEFLFGINGGNPPSPIFIFKTQDFDTTFAGMLDWEITMSSNLAPLFGPVVQGKFEDVILRNKDTRMLKDGENQTRIVYGFPNTETLLVTTNEDSFFEVFERLTASNATRN